MHPFVLQNLILMQMIIDETPHGDIQHVYLKGTAHLKQHSY